MASFGGSAICPRCTKSVYAAEQVLGPGRKFYHKPCLACMTCKKRLDSFTLLEHDQEPYCKSCHAKNFGTHNISNRPDPLTPPRKRPTTDTESTSPLAGTGTPSNTGRFGVEALPRTVQLSPTRAPGSPDADADADAQLVLSPDEAADDLNTSGYSSRAMAPVAERYASAAMVQRRHMTGDGESPPRAAIPRTLTGGSPSPRRFGGDNPKCARCTKSVFFAEQVKAVGKIYHKGCLRCTDCNALLDSNRLRDHDGQPMCVHCHSKLHGPQGLKK
ncbi:LIM-domain-containing protein [Mycena olivaceomarginata]|nr:LIM-domain-containing protein [Mycena olivaceomarginata]